MTGRRLLYLNTHRLSAYAWQGGRLTVEGVFENDSDGWSRFAAYLQSQRRSHFSLLANVAEEGHVLETIPFLHGRDRQTLITRKIGQHFLGTPLAAATSLGYEKTQRKNEKLLLSGLTNPAHFEPWLQRMEKAEVALAGVYSIAQLGGALLGKLRLGAGRSLLLTLQDHSIRESYLVGGQVHFSRMAPLTDSSQAGLASAFAAEAGKLHQYLIGQRLVSRDEELPVFIVAHPQSIPAIERACPDRGPLSFTLVDSHVAAAKLKLHSLPDDNRCDRLFLQLLASQPPAQQFAGETHRHHYHLSQVRHGLIAAGLIVLVGSFLFAARETFVAQSHYQEAASLSASQADLERRYQAIAATFPELGIDHDTLRRLTSRYGDLVRQQRQPTAAYLQVSRVLDQMPAVVLDGLDWKNGPILPSTAAPADDRESIVIRGRIRLDRATARQTLAVFEQFVDALRNTPESRVDVLQRPFDIESGTPLRGGDTLDEAAQQRPFAIELVRSKRP